MRILRGIITNSNDISLIEATLSTWDALCQHQDGASLAADSDYRSTYAEVVQLYASLARNNTKKLAKATQPIAHHDALRLRKAGVSAIMSIFTPAEQFERPWNREFDGAFGAVLTNLRNQDKRDYIESLHTMNSGVDEKEGRDSKTLNRRQSISTVRTFSGYQEGEEGDPRAAEGTVQDADRLEEEEVGLLAIDCVRAIFDSQNRGQARAATIAFMRYTIDEQGRTGISEWATQLFRLITSWTPVQDRFVILFTAVETLRRLPVEGSDFRSHETFASMIRGVVCSELNLIGLSVMDVLLGLLATTIRTVAHCARPQTSLAGRDQSTSVIEQNAAVATIEQLKQCIAFLASHVYYSDQVTDMIAAILMRVKAYPTTSDMKKDIFGGERSRSNTRATGSKSPSNNIPAKTSGRDVSNARPATVAAASPSRQPDADLDGIADRPETSERTNSLRSGYFTTDEARICALEIIKDVIEIAQSSKKLAHGNVIISRNRVPVGIWEGTQWLARSGSEDVRTAYKNAVTAWANLESDEKDANVLDFESDDCFGKFAEKIQAPSVRGSIGHSHQSHPQLLMLPNFGIERRLSSGKNSSNGTELPKPRVRAKDLQEIMEGKRQVELQVGGSTETPDLKNLLANIQIGARSNRIPIMAAPPY